MALYPSTTYSRSDITAMLSALPFEEKKWTLNYLVNILVVPPTEESKPQQRVMLTDTVLQQARTMAVSGYCVSADEDGHGAISDFKY